MTPQYKNYSVSTKCPDCGGAITSYHARDAQREFGTVIRDGAHIFQNKQFSRILYILMSCGGCGRGGLAVVHDNGRVIDGTLEAFHPTSIDHAKLPDAVPAETTNEFREAELCAEHGAWRAGSAMLRSVLEKALKLNGYTKGSLKEKIDLAASDSVLTEARKNRAQQEVRVLGNDVLHDAWREVKADEFEMAHHYTQRVLEDLYDDRSGVEAILKSKNRLPVAAAQTTP